MRCIRDGSYLELPQHVLRLRALSTLDEFALRDTVVTVKMVGGTQPLEEEDQQTVMTLHFPRVMPSTNAREKRQCSVMIT